MAPWLAPPGYHRVGFLCLKIILKEYSYLGVESKIRGVYRALLYGCFQKYWYPKMDGENM